VSAAHGLLVVVAGPSGVGKGSVHARVRAALPDTHLSVSVTTRRPRPGERDGVDYHFVDRAGFEAMVASGALLEWAEYAGNLYGTPLAPVVEAVASGSVVVLDIEVQGAIQVKERVPDALLVFLLPPSLEELERRLRGRGTEDDAAVQRRMEVAQQEMTQQGAFDAAVVNDDLDRCAQEVLALIESARPGARSR
jgi:guanylate kinase